MQRSGRRIERLPRCLENTGVLLMADRPLIAICLPCQDEVKAEFAISLAALTFSSRQYGLALIRGSSSIVTNARNFCLDNIEALEQMRSMRFEWTLWLDSDIQFPPTTLLRLMQHGKDVVGATYPRRTPPHDVLSKFLPGKPITANSGLHEVLSLPLGCMLIRRAVFDKMKRPWFRLRFDE